MHDHHWLYNAPSCPNSVQWSEDNHLAIAAAHTAVILNPGCLNGPRAYALVSDGTDLSPLQVEVVPNMADASSQIVWAIMSEASAREGKLGSPTRSVAWSPAGCSPQAGCLLATVTADNLVRLFCAPAKALGCEWNAVMNVTAFLKQQCQRNNWQDLEALATLTAPPATGDTDGVLRLRGGGPAKRKVIQSDDDEAPQGTTTSAQPPEGPAKRVKATADSEPAAPATIATRSGAATADQGPGSPTGTSDKPAAGSSPPAIRTTTAAATPPSGSAPGGGTDKPGAAAAAGGKRPARLPGLQSLRSGTSTAATAPSLKLTTFTFVAHEGSKAKPSPRGSTKAGGASEAGDGDVVPVAGEGSKARAGAGSKAGGKTAAAGEDGEGGKSGGRARPQRASKAAATKAIAKGVKTERKASVTSGSDSDDSGSESSSSSSGSEASSDSDSGSDGKGGAGSGSDDDGDEEVDYSKQGPSSGKRSGGVKRGRGSGGAATPAAAAAACGDDGGKEKGKGKGGGKGGGGKKSSPRKARQPSAKKNKAVKKEEEEGPPLPPYNVQDTDPNVFVGLLPDCDLAQPAMVANLSSQLVTRRFLVLRSQLEELPRYKDREPIKRIDAHFFQQALDELKHLYGTALRTHKVDDKLLFRNARALCRHYMMKAEMEQRELEGIEVPKHRLTPKDKRKVSSGRPLPLPPYDASGTEPGVFEDLQLPGLNMTDYDVIAKAASNLVFQRFMFLRRQQPPEQVVKYQPSDRLREPDVTFLARSLAELKHLYWEHIKHKAQERTIMKQVRAKIRQKVIGTRPHWRADMGMMYAPPRADGLTGGSGDEGEGMDEGDEYDEGDDEQEEEQDEQEEEEGAAGDDAGPSTGRARRARKQVNYKEARVDDEDSESGDGGGGDGKGKKKGKKRPKPFVSVSEDSGVDTSDLSGAKSDSGSGSSDDLVDSESPSSPSDDGGDAGTDDEVLDFGVGRGRGRGRSAGADGRGGGRGGKAAAGDAGVGRVVKKGTSTGLARLAASTSGKAGSGWRQAINWRYGVPSKVYDQLPYLVQEAPGQPLPGHTFPHVGPHFHVVMHRGKKRPRVESCGTTARLAVARGKPTDNVLYDARVLSLAVLHCSWSPVCVMPRDAGVVKGADGADGALSQTRVCFLALGARSGVVHLLRYTLPDTYCTPSSSTPPASGADVKLEACTAAARQQAAAGNVEQCFKYMGVLKAHCSPPGPVTCTAWVVVTDAGDRWQLNKPRQALAGETLLLATGCGDGSIRLWRSVSSSPDRADILGWEWLAEVSPADSMAVTCLSLSLTELNPATGTRRLVLCAGKTVGSILAWRSNVLSSAADLQAAVTSGTTWLKPCCHGFLNVTGVTVAPWSHGGQSAAHDGGRGSNGAAGAKATAGGGQQGRQQGRQQSKAMVVDDSWQLVTSTGLDGNVLCWKLTSEGLQDAGVPQRFNPASAFNAPRITTTMPGSKRPAYGIATSSNDLVAAVARTTSVFQEEMAQGSATAKMTWMRVASGSVHLYTLFGPAPPPPSPVQPGSSSQGGAQADAHTAAPGGPLAPLLPRLAHQLSLQWPVADSVWDVAAAVIMAGWEPVAVPVLPGGPSAATGAAKDEDMEGDDGDDDDKDEEGGVGGDSSKEAELRQATQAVKHLAVLKQTSALLEVAEQAAHDLEARHEQESCWRAASEGSGGLKPLSSISTPAWRCLQCAVAVRRLVWTYLSNHQQLGKALSVLLPLLTMPAGSQGVTSLTQAQKRAASQHMLPPWLFEARTQHALQESEAQLMQLPVRLQAFEQVLRVNELELLQLHVWHSLGGSVESSGGDGGGSATLASGGKRKQGKADGKQGGSGSGGMAGAGLAAVLGPDAACLQSSSTGDAPMIWQLLMADWIGCLDPNAPGTRLPELAPLLKQVAAQARASRVEPPAEPVDSGGSKGKTAAGGAGRGGGVMREVSATLGGAKVCLAGKPVEAAQCSLVESRDGQWQVVTQPAAAAAQTSALCSVLQDAVHKHQQLHGTTAAGGGGSGVAQVGDCRVVLELPRCGATFQLCASNNAWMCPACQRRYMSLPRIRPHDKLPDVPYCVICAVRIGPAVPNSFLTAPAIQMQPIPPEPIVIS